MISSRSIAMAATAALSIAAFGAIRIPKERVIPVTFDQGISIQTARVGDHFTATVIDELDLPRATKLEGEIVDIRQKRGDHPAFVDMEFRTICLPSGRREDILAVPIRLDSKYVHRDQDGHFEVDKSAVHKHDAVLGGAIGGFILGSILRKPFEGTFIGILAGIVANETGALDDGTVVSKGQKLGALFEREAIVADEGDRGDNPPVRDQGGPGRRDDGTPFPPDRDPRRDSDFNLAIGKRPLRFGPDEQPFRADGAIMVPLKSAASQMRIDLEEGPNHRYFLETDDVVLRIEQDSDVYRLNGKRGRLSTNVIERGGVIYVPLGAFARLTKEHIYANGDKIAIKT